MDDKIAKDIYNLDIAIAEFLVPRLTAFKEREDSVPKIDRIKYKETGEQTELSKESWMNILQEMIDGFSEKTTEQIHDINTAKVNRALELFAAYYCDLWI